MLDLNNRPASWRKVALGTEASLFRPLVPALVTVVLFLAAAISSSAAPLILNEYNAVSSTKFLNGGNLAADDSGGQAGDLHLGRVLGNGGDWFELVLTEDGVDLRGWQFEIWVEGLLDTTLVLSQDLIWTQLQAGTIITVAEDQVEDVSYDPAFDDWWINLRADTGASGTYISATSFPVNNDDWQLVIKDSAGVRQYGPAGEGVATIGGVNSREIFRLEENPSIYIVETSLCYDDGDTYSSFGQPNAWAGGTKVQAFGPLREGGAPTSQCDETDLTPLGFDPDRLLDIDIVMDSADYESLRKEQRTMMDTFGGRCGDAPAPSPYTFYPADVTVDGTTLYDVGVRKKGFFGSVSRVKPALKVDFTEYGQEEKVYGLERMTLNNLQQDPSLLDQCLGFALFEQAGLVASRCNFAHVKVNGTSLGIYSNLESIKDPFLIRNYGDSTGNLYEGSVADFRENWIGIIEKKNNDDATDLEAIKAALEITDDSAALAALGTLIDLDQFLTYWALDGLIGNWDGYSGNANNYWFYKNPNTDLYEFFPWGLDDILGRDSPFSGGAAEARTIFDNSAISNRLWQIESVRQQYQTRIEDLIATVWDETALLAEIDRMESLITPVAGDLSGPIDETRSWILGRAARVASDFTSGPPEVFTTLAEKNCLEIQGAIAADFSTIYTDPLPAGLPPGSSLSVTSFELSGENTLTGVGTIFDPNFPIGSNVVALRLIGVIAFPSALLFNIAIHEEDVEANTPDPTAVGDSLGSFLIQLNLMTGNLLPAGFVVNSQVQFDQADQTEGGTISGSVNADLAVWIPHPVPEPSLVASMAAGLCTLAAFARRRQSPSSP